MTEHQSQALFVINEFLFEILFNIFCYCQCTDIIILNLNLIFKLAIVFEVSSCVFQHVQNGGWPEEV